MYKRYNFDFNIDIWIQNLEIQAESSKEAKEILFGKKLSELIEEGYVKDYEIQDLDYTVYDLSEYDEDIDEDFEIEDSASYNKFKLTFTVKNSLKGSAGAEEYLEDWCNIGESALMFTALPTEEMVRQFLKATVKHCMINFNKYNEPGDNEYEGDVVMTFLNIKCYQLDDDGDISDYSDNYKEYPNMAFMFRAKVKR